MPNRSPRRRQPHPAPGTSRNGSRRSHAASAAARRRGGAGVLPRPASEPALWAMPFAFDGNGGPDDDNDGGPEDRHILPRHHTCTEVCPPGLALSPPPRRSTEWEGKVVVTVTVEGSPGPVRAMVKLGASVEEAIGAVVDAYGREGRSPKLDPAAVASFQLHHNHFCLQSLHKAETVGQVGGRSFYLRRNCGGATNRSGAAGGGDGGGAAAASAGGRRPAGPLVLLPTHRFLSIIAARLSKIGRRLRKLWSALGCAPCG